jgi:hypothetical protein
MRPAVLTSAALVAALLPVGAFVVQQSIRPAIDSRAPTNPRVAQSVSAAPVDLPISTPLFTTLAELVSAADVIVVGRVDDVGAGRVFTDPTDPATGLLSQLAQLDVEQALKGNAGGRVIVESEATLLDGTPITVGGAPPPALGERAIFFLVRGTTEEFPHLAVIGPQGQLLVGVDSRGADFITAASSDLLSTAVDGRELGALAADIGQLVQP